MIQASWVYACVTIILALIDAIRIKANWGKVDNIDHVESWMLAFFSGGAVCFYYVGHQHLEFLGFILLSGLLTVIAFIAIRLAVYDPVLNFLRILLKINPTMRLDYVSTETSSYEDQHSEKIGFWQKRALAVAAWGGIAFVYYKIFHTL